MGVRPGAMESMVMSGFWSSRNVLLTGHTGFKGSWLSLWLQQAGARVTGLSLAPPTSPNLFEDARVAEGMTSITADVRRPDQLAPVFQGVQPDVVFHLAAQSLVRESYLHPAATYETNVMGVAHVLDAVRQTPSVRAVVVVTSDKCYENREWLWGYRECEAMGGHDPYSSSKGCAELVTSAYRRSFFSGGPAFVASARAGNVIGGGDWAADRLIPDAVRAFRDRRPLRLRNPLAVRPWQHVLDCLRGYLLLAERLHAEGAPFADAWNFGPSDEDHMSVQGVIEHMGHAWGDGARWERDPDAHPHEAQSLRLDHTKARLRLGWRPVLSLKDALRMTSDWYRAWATGKNMRPLTEQHIRYLEEHTPHP